MTSSAVTVGGEVFSVTGFSTEVFSAGVCATGEVFSSTGFSAGGDFFSGSSTEFKVCDNAACALRNSRIPLPIARPTSGNLLGPKTIRATIKITTNSPAPIPNIKITSRKVFAAIITRAKLFSNIFHEKVLRNKKPSVSVFFCVWTITTKHCRIIPQINIIMEN